MAHAITYNSRTGLYEAMIRGGAWHNLGTVVENAQNWEDTMQMAGLNWTVSKQQLEFFGLPVPAYGIFRDDILAQGEPGKAFIAPSTEGYELLQNDYIFAFLDAVMESEDAHYESAGSLNGGAQVWALVNLKTAFEIGGSGDRFENYLCFTEDRTGKRAAKCFLTTVRVVCANTLEMAYGKDACKEGSAVAFRHSKSLHDKLQQAVDAFTGARMNIDVLHQKLQRLSERTVTRETLESVLNRIFPADEKMADTPARAAKFIDVAKLFESNDHNMFPEVRGTAYNLLNAVTEWTDHFSPVRRTAARMQQTDDYIRSERAMFGDGANLKASALDIILEETAHAPRHGTRRAYSVATSLATEGDDTSLLDSILSKN